MPLPSRKLPLSTSLNEMIESPFSLPPGLGKEEKKKFKILREKILEAVDPQDFIETIFVEEMSHLLLQIYETRHRIESLTSNAKEEGVIALLNGRCENLAELVSSFRRRDPEAIKDLKDKLQEFDLNQFDVDTHARQAVGKDIIILEQSIEAKRDQFERLVQSYEKRRLIVAERLRRLAEAQPKELIAPSEAISLVEA